MFKGKGTRTNVNGPDGMEYQWTPKGSYRLEQMLKTISHLPNCYNMFTPKNYAIYVLDDCNVHLALLKRGHIFPGIGGGITGDVQVNDTDLHSELKWENRKREEQLMIDQLRKDPKTMPRPSRDEMMKMLYESHYSKELKRLWITSLLDGSEDDLASENLHKTGGEKLIEFRNELFKTPSPKNLKSLLELITPPKGVKRKNDTCSDGVPIDKGDELFDCEGD